MDNNNFEIVGKTTTERLGEITALDAFFSESKIWTANPNKPGFTEIQFKRDSSRTVAAQIESNSDSSKTGAAKRDKAKTDAAQTDSPKTDATKTDAAKADAAKADAAKLDAAKADAVKSEATISDAVKTDAPKTDVPKKTDERNSDASKTHASKTGVLDSTRSLIKRAPILEHSLSAISARVAYLGVTDQLHVDQYTMRKSLERMNSPVSKQLVSVMDDLIAKDWQFLKEPIHSFKSIGSYNEYTRQLWYSEHAGLPGLMVGPSPVKRALAYPFSHELGHHKPPLCYWMPPESRDAETMAKRYLLAEAKAMLTEVHINEELKVPPHLHTVPRKTALMEGTLGAQILRDHAENTAGLRKADVPIALQDANANKLVNSYLEETYGRNLVDKTTGKIRPFDFKAGINGPQIAEIADDAIFRAELMKPDQYKALRKDPLFEHRTKLGAFMRLGETHTGSVLMRGAKAAGAVGGMLMVTDVVGAFQESTSSGLGRVGKLGTEIGGFEAGTAVGTAVSLRLLAKHPKTQFFIALGSGVLGAYAAGEYVGNYVESMIKEYGTNKPDRPIRLSDYSH